MRSIRCVLAIAALCLPRLALGSTEATGEVTGKVLDGKNAMALPMAPIEVIGTGKVFYTDIDGVFKLALEPGPHELKISFSGYKEEVARVDVRAGNTVKLDVILSTPLQLTEQVTVSASAEAMGSQAAVMVERKKAGEISEALSSEEMKSNADSDAAAAMQRVTGVSVVGGQYVYVRGLGERYSNTTLNGTVLPTTEPDKRVVPLDLIPSGLIQSLRLTKSYLPDKPAEFSGGLLEIEPVRFPRTRTLSASFSGGWNSATTFKTVETYPGGARDWLGFDDGTRALPSAVPSEKVVPRGVFGAGLSQGQIHAAGMSFANVWEPRAADAAPDSGFSIMAGNSWSRLGAVASLTYNRKHRYHEEEQQYYAVGIGGEGLRPTNDFDFRYSTIHATLGAVANLGYRFSDAHRVSWENFATNSGKDETRRFEGYQEDKGVPLRNTRLFWSEERILSSKLSGDHLFRSLSHGRLDWRLTLSTARRHEPDLRETLYEYSPPFDTYFLADESQSGLRMFSDLDERALQAEADWNMFFTSFGGRMAAVKVGGSWMFRDRDFSSRRLRMKPVDVRGVDLSESPEALFAPANVGGVFELSEDTRRTDRYDAQHALAGGFLMADMSLTPRLRLVGGARVEHSDQTVITRDLFDPNLPRIRSGLQNLDVLPGVNLVYEIGTDTNLRLALSQTVNRPEFRELAPYEFTDVVGGRAVVGNPDLKRALIRNADVRWEWFPSGSAADGEVMAVSVFYKQFQNPIERVIEATAQVRTSFANAEGARNFGLEVEARRALGRYVLAGFNYTYVSSEIELARGVTQVQTTLVRPLSGQSSHVLNGLLELRPATDLSARVLVNWFDQRISDVGAYGIPDIYEEGRLVVDAVLSKRFGAYALRLSGDNLTDSENLFTQGGLPQRSYRTGRSLSLSLSYSR